MLDNKLDVAALEQTLSISVLEVADGLLVDNGGSIVDAIGEPGKIKLSGLTSGRGGRYSYPPHLISNI